MMVNSKVMHVLKTFANIDGKINNLKLNNIIPFLFQILKHIPTRNILHTYNSISLPFDVHLNMPIILDNILTLLKFLENKNLFLIHLS